MKKVVCVGGGTGLFQVLTGLKDYEIELSTVVTMADDGGSSGELRDTLGILPPGDITLGLVALSEESDFVRQLLLYRYKDGSIDGQSVKDILFAAGVETTGSVERAETEKLYLNALSEKSEFAMSLLQYKYKNGTVNGHSVKNILFAVAVDISGSVDKAVQELSKMFRVKGKILPVTLDDTHLYATLKDGTPIKGETNIDIRKVESDSPIASVWLEPEARLYPPVINAILNADLLIFGPGDLYTSIIPNILVGEFPQVVQISRAKKIYVCNLFTKHGETDNYDALDFLDSLERNLGKGQINTLILHHNGFPPEILARYSEEKAYPVQFDLHRIQERGIEYLVQNLSTRTSPIRHDSAKLAHVIMKYLV